MGKAANFRRYLRFSSIGIEMGVATMIGVGAGWAIDRYVFDERYSPLFTLLFLLFGFAAGVKNLILLIKRSADNDDGTDDSR